MKLKLRTTSCDIKSPTLKKYFFLDIIEEAGDKESINYNNAEIEIEGQGEELYVSIELSGAGVSTFQQTDVAPSVQEPLGVSFTLAKDDVIFFHKYLEAWLKINSCA